MTGPDTETANGEIQSLANSPLEAATLDDFRGHEARRSEDSGYGDDADERAIAHIADKLSKAKAARGKSPDVITEQAESLYAMCVRKVTAGVDAAELAKIAALVGEKPDDLAQRLAA